MEISELEAFHKAEVTAFKHFLSNQIDTYRNPYGRGLERYPRHCVFVGTTNNAHFLKDPTGNRRFWVLSLPKTQKDPIDTRAVQALRDQIWAQAKFLYEAKEAWHLDSREQEALDQQNLGHTEEDTWEPAVLAYAQERQHFTTADMLSQALDLKEGVQDVKAKRRVSAILRQHGFKQTSYNATRVWLNQNPPEKPADNTFPS